jgi:hypothetical protein
VPEPAVPSGRQPAPPEAPASPIQARGATQGHTTQPTQHHTHMDTDSCMDGLIRGRVTVRPAWSANPELQGGQAGPRNRAHTRVQAGAAQPAAGFKGACCQQLPKMFSLEQFGCTHIHTPHNTLLAALTQGCGCSRRPMSLSDPPTWKGAAALSPGISHAKASKHCRAQEQTTPKEQPALLHRSPRRWGLVPQEGPTPGTGSALNQVGACLPVDACCQTCSLLPKPYIHLSKTAARCALLPAGVHSPTPHARSGALHHARTIGC